MLHNTKVEGILNNMNYYRNADIETKAVYWDINVKPDELESIKLINEKHHDFYSNTFPKISNFFGIPKPHKHPLKHTFRTRWPSQRKQSY